MAKPIGFTATAKPTLDYLQPRQGRRSHRRAGRLARARAWLRDEHVLAPADSVDLVAACAGFPYGLADVVRILQEVRARRGARPRRARHGGARGGAAVGPTGLSRPAAVGRGGPAVHRAGRGRPAASAGTGSTAELLVAVAMKEAISLPAKSWSATLSSPGVGAV